MAGESYAPAVVTYLAIVLGIVHGWSNGAGIAAAGREGRGLIGVTVTIFVLAASGLLLLGWTLSGRW